MGTHTAHRRPKLMATIGSLAMLAGIFVIFVPAAGAEQPADKGKPAVTGQDKGNNGDNGNPAKEQRPERQPRQQRKARCNNGNQVHHLPRDTSPATNRYGDEPVHSDGHKVTICHATHSETTPVAGHHRRRAFEHARSDKSHGDDRSSTARSSMPHGWHDRRRHRQGR